MFESRKAGQPILRFVASRTAVWFFANVVVGVCLPLLGVATALSLAGDRFTYGAVASRGELYLLASVLLSSTVSLAFGDILVRPTFFKRGVLLAAVVLLVCEAYLWGVLLARALAGETNEGFLAGPGGMVFVVLSIAVGLTCNAVATYEVATYGKTVRRQEVS